LFVGFVADEEFVHKTDVTCLPFLLWCSIIYVFRN
jgi:hypothetical protein